MNASDWGIEPGYRDVRGRWWQTPRETEAALLTAMGATDAAPPPSRVRIIRAGRRVLVGPVELVAEDGGVERVEDVLPPDLPPGYHRLVDRATGESIRLIASPGRCYLPSDLRIWAWAVQTYALRSRRSWGIGDVGDLKRFTRWSATTGAGAVLINPLHSSEPFPHEDSPYYPGSRCWRNPLYVRIDDVPGAMDAGDDIGSLAASGMRLNALRMIDRPAVHSLKMQALELLWRRFQRSGEFDGYASERGEPLERFATFVALAEKHGDQWRRWPAELHGFHSGSVHRFADANRQRVRFHTWVQWLLDRQVAAAAPPLRLINDLAVGVNPRGADTWLFSGRFAEGVTVGAPPDDFNLRGQGWGVAAFDPWKLRAEEYEPFIQTIRSCLRHAGGLRYDHVMGLFRLFWIPDGAEPADGAYVRYPHSDLLDIVALESHRAGAVMIGEDLGTVEPRVRDELQSRGLLSYRLMYFEAEEPSAYPECALAAITNHDLPTLPGLLSGADLDEQKRVGVVPNETFAESAAERARHIAGVDARAPISSVVTGCYRRIADSPSRVVAATLEDALGVEQRPNLPGTTVAQRPNWRISLPLTLEDIEEAPGPRNLAAIMGAGRASR